jgi:hypothetical protein
LIILETTRRGKATRKGDCLPEQATPVPVAVTPTESPSSAPAIPQVSVIYSYRIVIVLLKTLLHLRLPVQQTTNATPTFLAAEWKQEGNRVCPQKFHRLPLRIRKILAGSATTADNNNSNDEMERVRCISNLAMVLLKVHDYGGGTEMLP